MFDADGTILFTVLMTLETYSGTKFYGWVKDVQHIVVSKRACYKERELVSEDVCEKESTMAHVICGC